MDSIVPQLLQILLSEGGRGVTALTLLITVACIVIMFRKEKEYKQERKELIEQFQKQSVEDREDLIQIITKYQEGQISVIQAINEIRILLATIGAKL